MRRGDASERPGRRFFRRGLRRNGHFPDGHSLAGVQVAEPQLAAGDPAAAQLLDNLQNGPSRAATGVAHDDDDDDDDET